MLLDSFAGAPESSVAPEVDADAASSVVVVGVVVVTSTRWMMPSTDGFMVEIEPPVSASSSSFEPPTPNPLAGKVAASV